MRIKVALLEQDRTYLEKFVNVFNNRYYEKIEMYSFTNLEDAAKALRIFRIDVFIASDDFEVDTENIPNRCGFAYFLESREIESYKGQKVICKYQKADTIYKAILGLYAEKSASLSGIKQNIDSNIHIVTFVSAGGGEGSSTVAVAFAKRNVQMGKKVLYLNLEKFGDSNIYFHGEGNSTLSDVLYIIKGKKSNIALKIESSIRYDNSGVQFIDSCKNAMDVMEIRAEDVETIINNIKLMDVFDILVFDVDFEILPMNLEIYKYSDRIVFVHDGTAAAKGKLEKAYDVMKILNEQKSIPLLQKTCMLYNKFKNSEADIPQTDISVLGAIPKYSASDIYRIIDEIATMTFLDKIL